MTWQIMHCSCVTVDHSGLFISDDTDVLIKSAKTAASASNATVSDITERLRNISQEVDRITLSNVSVTIDNILIDADRACEYSMIENSTLLKYYTFSCLDFLNSLILQLESNNIKV